MTVKFWSNLLQEWNRNFIISEITLDGFLVDEVGNRYNANNCMLLHAPFQIGDGVEKFAHFNGWQSKPTWKPCGVYTEEMKKDGGIYRHANPAYRDHSEWSYD